MDHRTKGPHHTRDCEVRYAPNVFILRAKVLLCIAKKKALRLKDWEFRIGRMVVFLVCKHVLRGRTQLTIF